MKEAQYKKYWIRKNVKKRIGRFFKNNIGVYLQPSKRSSNITALQDGEVAQAVRAQDS